MIQDVAAKRYAEAAYLIALQDGTEAVWLDGLTAMAALGTPEAQAFLQNSRAPAAQKAALLDNALKGVDPLVLNLARLLLRRNKTNIAHQIREAFQELIDKSRGISHAIVTSAVPLSEDELKAATERLSQMTGGQVIVQTRVDESILGGLVVQMGDRLIDGSTRSRLQALRRQLVGAER